MHDDRRAFPSRSKLFPNVVDNVVDSVVAVDDCLLNCAVVVAVVAVAVVELPFVVVLLATLHSVVVVAPAWIVWV